MIAACQKRRAKLLIRVNYTARIYAASQYNDDAFTMSIYKLHYIISLSEKSPMI